MFSLMLSGIFWGTGGLTGTLLGRETGLSALAIAAFRLSAGGLLILCVLAVSRASLPRGNAAWRRIALIGLLTAMFQACYFASIAVTSVSIATLVSIGATPVLVLTAETLSGQRKADRWSIFTVCLALTGFLLLVGVPQNEFSISQMLAGAGLALAASAGFATVTIVSSRPVSGLDDLTTTGYAFTFGGGALALIAWPVAGLAFPVTSSSIALLALLGTLPTAVAYTLYFRGLRTASASTASLMALLEPLTGTVLAAIFLHDRLSPAGLSGAALMIAAITIAAKTPRPAPA